MDVKRLTRRPLLPSVLVILLTGLFCWPAAGDRPSRPVPSPQQQPAPGQIDRQLSRVYVFVGKTGLGHEHGVQGMIKEGSVRLGAAQQAGQIIFDMTSFRADTPEARRYVGLEGTTSASTQRAVTANMLGRDVLDAAHYPTAVFAIHSARPLRQVSRAGNPVYQLEGQFTLHGVTRPLRLNAEAIPQRGRIRLRGAFRMLQSNFGIKPYTKAFGAVGVTDELTVYGEIYLAASPR